MKQLSVCIVALLFFSNSWAGSMIKAGLDLAGSQKKTGTINVIGYGSIDYSETYSPDSSLSIAYEYTQSVAKDFDLGIGISYELSRALDKKGGNYNFIPIYGVGKLNISQTPFYAIGHLGYNLINADSTYKINDFYSLTGGLYYGVGVGFDLKTFVIEAIYSVNNASADGKGYYYSGGNSYASTGSGKITNSKVNVSVGYKF